MEPELLGDIQEVETIAAGDSIRVLPLLEKKYGRARWRKLKAIALVRLPDGTVARAEVHWYEAHGVGRKDLRIKRLLS
ncbi:MAG: hypothetical protein ACRDHY_08335 [Anaerolineales bacterium]